MRRLRENAMLEAEINPSGDVVVEGHHVGSLQGFRFTADQSAGGEDAKAVKAAAQKALAAEFDVRAERFANSANGDFVLASDGIVRWIGAPVAVLTSSEDVLAPRVILLADEQLTGASRDKVVARIERFVRFQIESLLKPLIDLKDAEQLSGIARGVAFRLVENLGLINRREIADEVKSLDQDARAALRRLGVRFGAFHVFVPTLLKPAPAGLITLLWSLIHDGKDKPGFGDIVNALASGRTSVVVDPSFATEFYQLAGFRILGHRAVRVDILERLADLIRPALAWRAGSGARPDGAYDGSAFVVTPAMMSILGATADDMEEILKGLGYRSEAKSALDVTAKFAELDAAEAQRLAAKAAAANPAEAAATSDEAENSEAPAVVSEAVEAEVSAEAVEQQQEEAVAVASADDVEKPAEDAKPILLWRPARFEARRPQQNRRKGEPGQNQSQGRNQRRDGEQEAGNRPDRKKFKDRSGGGRQGGRGDKDERRDHRRDKASDNRHGTQDRQREERPARIDPDSPFAKLAALREQFKK